jgi:hypothetical protein
MARSVLLATDSQDATWVDSARDLAGAREIHLFILGGNVEEYLARNRERLRDIQFRLVSPQKHSETAQRRLQEFYPDFVHRFPRIQFSRGRTLFDLLRWKRGPNLWWFGTTCEKSPLRGRLIHQLYRLALLDCALNDLNPSELWLWLDDADLRGCIERNSDPNITLRVRGSRPKGFTLRWFADNKTLLMLGRMLALRIRLLTTTLTSRALLWWMGVKALRPSGGKLVVFYSRYPALWRNEFTDGLVERYFGLLEGRLVARASIAFFVWLSNLREIWQRRRTVKSLLEKKRISPLVLYVSAAELLVMLFDVRLVAAYVYYHFRVSPELSVSFLRWDVATLFDTELRRDLTGEEAPRNMLMFFAARRFTGRLQPAALVNPLEFQPMERAIWAGAEGRTRRVAVQHSAYCRNHLMYFFGKGELSKHTGASGRDASPLPDYYVAAGSRPRRQLEANGIASSKIALCGALRYNDLRLEMRSVPIAAEAEHEHDTGRQAELLVLTSQLRAESLALVRIVAEVAAKRGSTVRFSFKTHYHCRLEDDIAREFSTHAPVASYRLLDVHGSWHDYVRDADAVIVGATTAALEVVALGHAPLVYLEPAELPLCPIIEFKHVYRPFCGAEELAQAIAQSRRRDAGFDEARRLAIEESFFELDGRADERFVALLEQMGAV